MTTIAWTESHHHVMFPTAARKILTALASLAHAEHVDAHRRAVAEGCVVSLPAVCVCGHNTVSGATELCRYLERTTQGALPTSMHFTVRTKEVPLPAPSRRLSTRELTLAIARYARRYTLFARTVRDLWDLKRLACVEWLVAQGEMEAPALPTAPPPSPGGSLPSAMLTSRLVLEATYQGHAVCLLEGATLLDAFIAVDALQCEIRVWGPRSFHPVRDDLEHVATIGPDHTITVI